VRSCPKCCTAYTSDVDHCALDGERLIEDLEDPMIGQIIDRYEIVEALGEGAMAAVYRARHQVIEREVACKVLFGEYAGDKQFAERFRREAQAASKVKHPNVVEVLDFGQTENGATFLLMELLEGQTLQEGISAQGAFNPRRASWIVRDIAAGLQATHEAGMIHRDLKPGNIMLVGDADGKEVAKILDFGVVQAMGGQGKLTQTGQTLGTPYYMSPEQVGGNRDLTPASDLYSLGVVVYEMLRGQAPFRGSFGEVLVKQVTEKPEALPASKGLEDIATWLLEKEVGKRPSEADEVIERVAALDLGERVPFFAIKPGQLYKGDDAPTGESTPAMDLQVQRARVEEPETVERKTPTLSRRSAQLSVGAAGVAALALIVTALVYALGGEPADADATPDKPAAARVSYDGEVDDALRARGLTRADAENLRDVKPLMVAWQEAKERGEGEAPVVASLLSAIARAPVDVEVLAKKRDRVIARGTNAPRAIADRIIALPRELETLSSAERSQLARELDELERALSGK
jgi:serine/threonine-protein kinase